MKVLKNKKVRNLTIVLLVLGLAVGSYAYANTQNDQGKFGDGQKMAQGAPLPKTPKVARPMRVPKGIRVLY